MNPADQTQPKTQPRTGTLIPHIFVQQGLGIIGVALVGALLGLTFSAALVSHFGEPWGLLSDYISAIYILPGVMLLFGLFSWIRRDWLLLAYPICAFFVAGGIVSSSLVALTAYNIPIPSPEKQPEYLIGVAAVLWSYIIVQLVLGPVRTILREKYEASEQYQSMVIANIIAAGIWVLLLASISILANPVLHEQQRTRQAVNVPETNDYFGEPSLKYTLYYPNAVDSSGIKNQETDSVIATPIKNWWERNTHSICGDSISKSTFPGQQVDVSYHTTPGGVRYGVATFAGNDSQPPVPTSAYKESHYCFVVGYHWYDLSRKESNRTSYQAQYPADSVIDAIIKSKSYLPECSTKKPPSYCKSGDHESNTKLAEQKAKLTSQVIAPTASKIPGVTTPRLNASAYKEVGRLTISQWGISFPLSAGLRDAYYAPKTPNQAEASYTLGLGSLSGNVCKASNGGYGIASIRRTKISEIKTELNKSIEGVVVGEYVYSLYANSNLRQCLQSVGKSESDFTQLSDQFEWAEAGIK